MSELKIEWGFLRDGETFANSTVFPDITVTAGPTMTTLARAPMEGPISQLYARITSISGAAYAGIGSPSEDQNNYVGPGSPLYVRVQRGDYIRAIETDSQYVPGDGGLPDFDPGADEGKALVIVSGVPAWDMVQGGGGPGTPELPPYDDTTVDSVLALMPVAGHQELVWVDKSIFALIADLANYATTNALNTQKTRIDNILAGANGDFDTFVEIYNKFITEDSEQAAMLATIATKLTTPSGGTNGKVLGFSGGVPAWIDPPAGVPRVTIANAVPADSSGVQDDLHIRQSDGRLFKRGSVSWTDTTLNVLTAGANGKILSYQSGAPVWIDMPASQTVIQESKLFGRRGYRNRFDPIEAVGAVASGTAVPGSPYTVYSSSGSITVSNNAVEGRLRGRVLFQTGTSASGVSAIYDSNSPFVWNSGMAARFATHIRVGTLSDASNRYEILAGFARLDSTLANALAQNSSVFFRYSHDVNGGKWALCYITSGNSLQTVDTGVTAVVDTNYHLEIRIAADKSVAAYINGNLVATVSDPGMASANGPVGSPGMGFYKTAGTTNRTGNSYYLDTEITYDTVADAWATSPPLTIPIGGANGKYLGYSGGIPAWLDFPAPAGGVPTGGVAGSKLAKKSATDSDTFWFVENDTELTFHSSFSGDNTGTGWTASRVASFSGGRDLTASSSTFTNGWPAPYAFGWDGNGTAQNFMSDERVPIFPGETVTIEVDTVGSGVAGTFYLRAIAYDLQTGGAVQGTYEDTANAFAISLTPARRKYTFMVPLAATKAFWLSVGIGINSNNNTGIAMFTRFNVQRNAVPTGGNTGDVLTKQASGIAAWQAAAAGGLSSRKSAYLQVIEDFSFNLTSTTTNNATIGYEGIKFQHSGEANNSVVVTQDGTLGVQFGSASLSVHGVAGAFARLGNSAYSNYNKKLQAGPWEFCAILKVPAFTSPNFVNVLVGWHVFGAIVSAAAGNQLAFAYVSGSNWKARRVNAGVVNDTDTGVANQGTSNMKFEIKCNAAGTSAAFYINDALVATHDISALTNVNGVSAGVTVERQGADTTAARTIEIDLIEIVGPRARA